MPHELALNAAGRMVAKERLGHVRCAAQLERIERRTPAYRQIARLRAKHRLLVGAWDACGRRAPIEALATQLEALKRTLRGRALGRGSAR